MRKVLMLALAVCTALPADATGIEDVRAECRQLVASGKVPSLVFAVVRDGKVVLEEGFGYADAEKKTPAAADTFYTLASTGKSITATAVMLLASRGKIDLDAPVNRYLGATPLRVFEGKADDVTVRSLLMMKVGIPHLWWHGWRGDPPPPSTRELIQRYGIVVFPAGNGFHYSNLTYGILGQVVENVSGVPLDEFLRREIFAPLEMKRSSLRPSGSVSEPKYLYSEPVAGAAYQSTAHDLALFALAHLGDSRLLPRDVQQTIHGASASGYGFGWGRLRDKSGIRIDLSNGGIVGAMSTMLVLPEKKFAAIVLSNVASDDRITDDLAQHIAAALVSGYAGELALPSPAPPKIDDTWNGTWSGEMRSWNGTTPIALRFTSGGEVFATAGNAPEARLENALIESDDGFEVLRGRIRGQLPITDLAGQPQRISFRLHRDGERLFGSAMVQNDGKSLAGLGVYVNLRRGSGR